MDTENRGDAVSDHTAENDARSSHIERITSELLLTDALTGNDEGTPTHYTVHADDVEYLVRTVLDLASQIHEERIAELARVIPSGPTADQGGRRMTHHTGSDEGPDVDALAQEIRRVDGNHGLGAGALAEALLPFLAARAAAPDALRERVEDELDAIWRESQGDRTIIRDAGIMQDIVRRLRAVLAEQ